MAAQLAPLPVQALVDVVDDGVVLFRRPQGAVEVLNTNEAARAALATVDGGFRAVLQSLPRADGRPLAAALAQGRTVELTIDLPSAGPGRPWRVRFRPLPDGLWAAVFRDLGPLRALEHDALTGLWTRRTWSRRAEAAFAHARDNGQPIAVTMLDLDHFKRLNDRHGHPAGDAVLRAVADVCRTTVRQGDVVGRVGGEEIAVVAPDTSLAGASTLAVRLCHAVRALRIVVGGHPLSVTVSAGVAERSALDDTLEGLRARADRALYQAKAEGRDRVCVA